MDDGNLVSPTLEIRASGPQPQVRKRTGALFATRRYNIETVIGKGMITCSAARRSRMSRLSLANEVLKFGPASYAGALRRVSGGEGPGPAFHSGKQKGRRLLLRRFSMKPPAMGQTHSITVEYGRRQSGEPMRAAEVTIRRRRALSWYPNLNGFGEKSALRSYVQGSALEPADQRGQGSRDSTQKQGCCRDPTG